MIEDAGGLAAILLRGASLLGILAVLGGWSLVRLVLPRATGLAGGPYRTSLGQASAHVARAGAALVALLVVPRGMVEALGITQADAPSARAVATMLGSGWGVALVVQGVAAALVFVGLRGLEARGGVLRITDVAVAVLAVTPSFLGHAAADPDHALASVIVDALHVVSAGGWIGALLVLTLLTFMLRSRSDAGPVLAALFAAFHPMALASAGGVFVTGLATAWLRMGAPEGIANSTYSGLFVAKVVLVFAVGAVGAGHAKLAKRRVSTVDVPAVTRSLLGETLLAMLVLGITAVLAGTAPIG